MTAEVDMFGNSWMEAKPNEAVCLLVISGFPSPCAGLDDHFLLVRSISSLHCIQRNMLFALVTLFHPVSTSLKCLSSMEHAIRHTILLFLLSISWRENTTFASTYLILISLCVATGQKVEEVCAMLLEEPFLSCHAIVSPLPYMASCSNDLCL